MSTFSGGFLRPTKDRRSFVPMYWGDGSDGILTAGDIYHAGTDYDKYSGLCIKQFTSINWVPGSPETLTVDEPCRGLILFVKGNVNIGANATISMAKMGSVLPANPAELIDLYGDSVQMRHIVETLKTLKGGAGGDGGTGASDTGTDPVGGTGGIGRICQGGRGGGGSGGANTGPAGYGGSVDSPEVCGYAGLSGPKHDGFNGGGGACSNREGGNGGHPLGAGGGGGSLDYGGTGYDGEDGEHTGGFILIIAKGAVTIAGTLDVTGGDGGDGGAAGLSAISYVGGSGGGAGGGVIAIFAGTSVVDTSGAIINKAGGSGGAICTDYARGQTAGTGGQQGTYYQEQI